MRTHKPARTRGESPGYSEWRNCCGQAGIVYVGLALSFSIVMIACVNLALTGLWLVTALSLKDYFQEKAGE